MLSIKIEIGLDKQHTGKKKETDIKRAAFLAALLDSIVWIADTVLLLELFYAISLFPFGIFILCGDFVLYLTYFFIKTQLLTKKYGKELYQKEFGYTGIWLAVVSVALLMFLIVTSVSPSL